METICEMNIWSNGLLKVDFISKIDPDKKPDEKYERQGNYLNIGLATNYFVKMDLLNIKYSVDSRKSVLLNERNLGKVIKHFTLMESHILYNAFGLNDDGLPFVYAEAKNMWFGSILLGKQNMIIVPAISENNRCEIVKGVILMVNKQENTLFIERSDFMSLCWSLSRINIQQLRILAGIQYLLTTESTKEKTEEIDPFRLQPSNVTKGCLVNNLDMEGVGL